MTSNLSKSQHRANTGLKSEQSDETEIVLAELKRLQREWTKLQKRGGNSAAIEVEINTKLARFIKTNQLMETNGC